MKRLLKGTVAALVALVGAAAQAVPNVLVNLDATDFDPVQVAWTNNGSLGGVFVPVGSGEGTTYGIVDGIAAVSLAGDDSSVMTNGVSPNAICADVPWSFEAWVHNPAAQLNEDIMFTWTAREQWPNNQPNGSCVEFRYGKDSGNAVEHYAENLGWGGELPAFGQWHHVAVTRDAGGVERLYLNGVLRVTQYRNVNARDDIGFFTLGAVQNRNDGGWQFPFSGSFARLRVHDGPLGIEDIFANIQADLAAFGVSMSSARYWKGAPGVWDAWATGANWVGGGVPLDGDSVIFDNGGKAGGFAGTITLQNFMGYDGGFEMTGGDLTSLNTVTMGLGAGRSFDFQLKGGKFNIPGTDNRHLLMGENTSAQAVIGGTGVPAWLCVDKDIHLARRDGGDGYMEILPNGLVTTSNGWLYLTCEGVATGTLVVAGGTVRNERGGPLVVGQGRGGKATLIVNSGYAGPFGEMRVSGDQNNEGSVADIFLNGGTTEVQRVRADWAGINTFHFNGGTLRNRDGTPRTDFMHGLTAALVQPGGACFDVIADTTIEVYQNLLEDPSDTGGGLVKTGPGTLVLRGANTFTGGITVGGGALFLRNDDALPGGYAGNILLQGGGIGWETAGGAGALLGLLDQSSSGALFLFGVNESDPIDLSQHPGVSLGMTGNMEYQGALSPSGGGGYYRFTVTGGGNHYGQVIAGNMGLILEEASTGYLGLHGDNTYTGDTLIYGGTIYMYHANALGNPLTKQNARDIGIYNGTAIALDVPITQAFLDRIKTDSRGSIVLINDNNNNESFDFSALPGVTLGSSNWRDYWGTVTPHAGVGYHFGGGGQPWWDGGLRLRNLTDAPGGIPRKVIAEFPGTVELVEAQSFSGGIVVTNGANLRVNRDDTMGIEPSAPTPDYLLISGGSLRIESDGGLPMLTHTNRGLTVGSGGTTFYPPGNRYTAWMGGLNGSGPIMASDNGVLMFGGENNTWDGILTMASDNEDGAFTVGYGDTFSWPRDNIIQGNGQFGVSTDLDITWSDKFANPLGNVPPQPDATDGKNARLGLRKLGAGTLTLDTVNTYRRNTRIESGTLKVGIADAIPWGTVPGVGNRGDLDFRNSNFFPRGTLDINGFDVNVNGILGSGTITNANPQGGGQTLTFGHDNRSGTFLGAIDPAIKAVKTGGSTQTFRKGSSMGGLTVRQGTVAAGPGGVSLGDVALEGNGAAFQVGLDIGDTYGLIGEYYWFDLPGLTQLVGPGRLGDLTAFEDFLAGYAPWTVASSASFGEGFDAAPNGARFQDGHNGRSQFYARWSGEFYAAETGEYEFGTVSDDGSVVYVQRTLVVDNDHDQGYDLQNLVSGIIWLEEGWHDIIVGYYQGGGDKGLTVFMAPPGETIGDLTQMSPTELEAAVLPQALLRPYPVTVESLAGTSGSRVEMFGNTTLAIAGNTPTTYTGRLVGTSADARLVKNGAATLILAGQATPEFNGQIIINGGDLGLQSASPSARPIRIRDGGTLFALAAEGGLPNIGLNGSYYWGYYGGTSFAELDNVFRSMQFGNVYNTAQYGWSAAPTAVNFWYDGTGSFPGEFSSDYPPAGGRPNFCVRFQGKFLALEPGDYTFELSTDNRGDVYLNGEHIIEGTNWDTGFKGETRYLEAGTHDLQIAYGYWNGGGYTLLQVTPPGGDMMQMPNAWLRPSVSMIYGIEGDGNLDLPDVGSYLSLRVEEPQTFAGSIAGVPGSELEKNGADTLTLVGDNDAFEGGWLVLNGTLVVGDGGTSGTLGGTGVYVGAGGMLVFNRADDYVYAGRISGKGEIRSIGAGRVILTGSASAFEGTLTSGTFVFTGESVSVPASCLAQGDITVHFEDGAQLIFPLPTGTPLELPTLVFSNGTVSLPFAEDSSYYMDSLMISAGTTLQFSLNSLNGLLGRYYALGPGDDPGTIAPHFESLAAYETYIAGLEPLCTASTWEAGDVMDFGSYDDQTNFPLKFPQSIIDRKDNFTAIWKGKIRITTPGAHTFQTWSDDNSMLYINGNLVVNNNGSHGMETRSGQVTLAEGLHDIAILFAQGGGGYGLTVSIEPPGQPLQLLPNSMLVAHEDDIADLLAAGLPGLSPLGMPLTLEVGTLGVVNGPGTGTLDITGSVIPLDGTLLLNGLYIESPGAVIATKGNTQMKGGNLHVEMGCELPKSAFTLIGDFTQTASYGLPLAGKTMTLGGTSRGRLIYKPATALLYASTVDGTVLILR